jgi:hypothetical protein
MCQAEVGVFSVHACCGLSWPRALAKLNAYAVLITIDANQCINGVNLQFFPKSDICKQR